MVFGLRRHAALLVDTGTAVPVPVPVPVSDDVVVGTGDVGVGESDPVIVVPVMGIGSLMGVSIEEEGLREGPD